MNITLNKEQEQLSTPDTQSQPWYEQSPEDAQVTRAKELMSGEIIESTQGRVFKIMGERYGEKYGESDALLKDRLDIYSRAIGEYLNIPFFSCIKTGWYLEGFNLYQRIK